MKKRRSVTAGRYEDWVRDYEAWKANGETQDAFCKTRGYSTGTFKSRLKQLRKMKRIPDVARRGVRAGIAPAVSSGGFAAVRLSEPPVEHGFGIVGAQTAPKALPNAPYCEIRFRDAGRLVIEEAAGIERLREFLSVNLR